jgi:hypothetical protein
VKKVIFVIKVFFIKLIKGQRLNCPKGFHCSNYGMSLPALCENSLSKNCYEEKITAPLDNIDGTLTVAPYYPPLLSNPGKNVFKKGYFIQYNDDKTIYELKQCFFYLLNLGILSEYCPLGRSSNINDRSNLLCPAGTFCIK